VTPPRHEKNHDLSGARERGLGWLSIEAACAAIAKEPKNGLAGWVRMMPVQTRRPLTASQLAKDHTFQVLKITTTWVLIYAVLLRLIVWWPYHLWRVSRERKARHWLGE